MKKITFDKLFVEVTRRCNLSCAHCLHGESENIDISYEDIDSLLEQTDMIMVLFFAGGEPTICVEKMQYFLDKMIEKDIFLGRLEIVINGKEQSSEFVKVIKNYSDYIKSFYIPILGEDVDMTNFVDIRVSADRYHKGYNILDSYYFYKVNLYEYARVKQKKTGNNPMYQGRAKNLPEAFYDPGKPMEHQRIEILTKELKPVCPNYLDYKLYYEDQIYVCCELYVTAKGEILNAIFSDVDYETIDKMTFCHVTDDIYSKIIEYNKDLPLCVDCMKARQEVESDINRKTILTNYIIQPNKKEKISNLFNHVIESSAEYMPNYYSMFGNPYDYDMLHKNCQEREYKVTGE